MIDIKFIIAGVAAVVIFGSGWWVGYSKYLDFKKEVEIAAKTQEAHVESIKKQQALVTQGIEKEYNAKLALLRNYYANGVRNTSSGAMPTNGNSTLGINDFTPNGLLVKCAETTQQLVSLQEWLNEQMGIK